MANSKSVPKIRIGSLKAAISPNDTEGRIRYTITFSHLYKDGEQWKTTQTFDRNDLLILAKVADQAHTRIFKLQQGKRCPTRRNKRRKAAARASAPHQ